jgi:hypothetical protein
MRAAPLLPTRPARAPQMSPEEIFENAEMQFASEDFDGARRNFKRALDLEPEVRACMAP